MTPGLTGLNLLDGPAADPEPGRQGTLVKRTGTNQPNIVLSELRQPMLLADSMIWMRRIPAPTLTCLAHVLILITGAQMRRLNTDRLVTAVQNIIARSYRAFEYLMADTVGKRPFLDGVVADHTVSLVHHGTAPVPAQLLLRRQTRQEGRFFGHKPPKRFFGSLTARTCRPEGFSASVPKHSLVVHSAHRFRMDRSFATCYRTRLHMCRIAYGQGGCP